MDRERIAGLERDWLDEKHWRCFVREPFVFPCLPTRTTCRRIPIIGPNILAEGWEKTEHEWFVDSWGGDKRGPALSQDRFLAKLTEYVKANPEHGFAITGVGQFQVYVSAYKRV